MSKVVAPWKHQAATLKKHKRLPYLFDMSDPGTGKTRPAIEFSAAKVKNGRTLVIAVKSNLEVVWRDEVHKWAPGKIPVVATAENRMAAFTQKDSDFIITNIDAVKWIKAQGKVFFKKLRIKHVIFDESTHFKNPNAARSRAALWIRQQPSIEFVTLMSGTPNPLSVTELWHQMMLLDLGQRLGQSFYKFRSSVCEPEQIRVPGGRTITKWEDKRNAEEAVFGVIAPVSIRHEFEKCLSLPPNITTYKAVHLPRKLQADYDLLLRTALLEHATNPIVGTNRAVLHGKLLQLCSGAVYGEDESYRVFDRARYELVADLVAERPHASISFFLWHHQKECLSEELSKRGIEHAMLDSTVTQKGRREEIVNALQSGDIQHLAMHPRTGAHGLTLTTARTSIWCSPVPSPELFKQGGHRIYRGGQKFKTETICIHAPSTVEQELYESMFTRKKRMTTFLDLVAEAG